MEEVQERRKIIWYGIPAYGHVYSNLYLANYLTENNFTVIYYATDEFQSIIEANGCEYRRYPVKQNEIDMTDGKRILKLYRLILQYTENMMPQLMKEAIREQPCAVIFESMALWGRLTGELLKVPFFSFYSIAAIDRVGSKAFFEYVRGFSLEFLWHVGEIPRIWEIRHRISHQWKGKKLDLLSVLMGQGDWNLMGYSRLFQPGGNKFDEKYRFLGPLSIHRITDQEKFSQKAVACSENMCVSEYNHWNKKMIYISLGTIFNQNEKLFQEMIKQFGRKETRNRVVNRKEDAREEEENGDYLVVMVWRGKNQNEKIKFPDNFIVREFVNQKEVMKQASLFISAGGMNSIHEALYYGVPCLICPQQGEQLINARRFEQLGFGRILRNPKKLREEAEFAMELKHAWDEGKRKEMTEVCLGKKTGIFPKVENTVNNKKETVLVTGATGFLGEYLVRRLTEKYRVLALGRNYEKGKKLEKLGAEFCPGDFTDENSCGKYFCGVKYVIHAGALSSVWGKWDDFYKTNVLGTDLSARLCYENGVQRIVYISSPSIYTMREDQYGIKEEQIPEKNDLNYYIKSKLMAEEIIRKWERRGLETVILRPRGLIGIGDTSLVPRLLRANDGVGIPLFRGGRNLVDLTSVENVALACELAMTAKGAEGQVFNLTNGEPMEFRVLLESFLKSAGEIPHYRKMPFKIVYNMAAGMEWIYKKFHLKGEPPLTKYTVCTLGFAQTMDISRAREILGYSPEKTLMESIEEYGKWWREVHNRQKTNGRDHIPEKIQKVVFYQCGFCTNNLAAMFRKVPWQKRRFPARAVLIQHKELGNILYDTGYSEKIFGKEENENSGILEKLLLKIYCFFNPVSLKPGDRIDEKLIQDGISPNSIRTVILSHGHPDHTGGLSRFSQYELIVTEEVLKSIKNPRIQNLVFSSQVSKIEDGRIRLISGKGTAGHFLCRYFEYVYDLFGDGSVIGVKLDGHCKGQMGIWIPDVNLFLAADACWGGDLVKYTRQMRTIPRMIQNNFKEYQDTLRRICQMKKECPEIRVVFAHQAGKEKIYVRAD